MTRGVFEFGEALATQTMRIAELAAAESQVDPTVAGTVRNVALTVAALVEPTRKAFESGDTETGMYGLAFMDGGCRLIAMLMSAPNHPLTVGMSKGFVPKSEEAKK